FRVQRFGVIGEGSAGPIFQTPGNNNIKIPLGTGIPGQATKQITFQGNLSADANGPIAAVLTSSQPFKAGGRAATLTTLLNNLDNKVTDYGATDKIVLQGMTASGTTINVQVNVTAASTVGDVVNAINTNFPGSTASLDAAGNLVIKAANAGPSQLTVT